MGGLSLPSRTAAGATGLAAQELTGDPDMDRMILAARDAQGVSRDVGPSSLTMPEYQAATEALAEFRNLPENTAYRRTGGGSGLFKVLSLAASVAIPFAAPALAGAIGASTAFGATVGSALTGAALGAGKAAVFGEDIGKGALLGGVSGGIGGYLQGAGATGAEATGGAGTSGTAGVTGTGTAGVTGTGTAGVTGASAARFAGVPEIVVTASRPAFGATNLIAPTVAGVGALGAVGGTAPVPEIIPEISPYETAGGRFVQTSAPQQSPVTTPSIDQVLTGGTPAGTYDPVTGLTGYIDQTGQFVQTASPLATPTGLELATGAAPAATIAQSPVFGVTDPSAATFGATGVMSAPVAGSVAGTSGIVGLSPQDLATLASLPSAGSSAPALNAINTAAGGGIGGYLGKVGSSIASSVGGALAPDKVADLILRGAGLLAIDQLAGGGDGSSALAGLSAEEQALVTDMRDELAKAQQEDENLFNERLRQAYALIGDVDYFDPEYFGLQSARRAQLQAARAKQAGLRGLTGEERAAEARRYDLETGRSTGTAYDVGYGTGVEARTRARQAGIEALPGAYPSRLSDYSSLANLYGAGADTATRNALARRANIAGLFGGLFGRQPEEDTNPQTART